MIYWRNAIMAESENTFLMPEVLTETVGVFS